MMCLQGSFRVTWRNNRSSTIYCDRKEATACSGPKSTRKASGKPLGDALKRPSARILTCLFSTALVPAAMQTKRATGTFWRCSTTNADAALARKELLQITGHLTEQFGEQVQFVAMRWKDTGDAVGLIENAAREGVQL